MKKSIISMTLVLLLTLSSVLFNSDITTERGFLHKNAITANASATTVSVSGKDLYSYAYQVLDKVNIERKNNGLSTLSMDSELIKAAMLRSSEISTSFSHTRPNGTTCFTVSAKCYGENIAYGQTSPTQVMNGWMNSPGHRANILNSNYKSIGIGCVLINGRYYWTQSFGFATATAVTKPSDVQSTRTVNLTTSLSDYSFTLAKSSYAYTGSAIIPAINFNGVSSKYYTAVYSGNTEIGKATVTVKGKGLFSGSKTLTFKIVPKSITGLSVSATANSATLSWAKVANSSGYKVYIYDTATSSWKLIKTISSSDTKSYTFSSLKSGTSYKLGVRAFKLINSENFLGNISFKAITTT